MTSTCIYIYIYISLSTTSLSLPFPRQDKLIICVFHGRGPELARQEAVLDPPRQGVGTDYRALNRWCYQGYLQFHTLTAAAHRLAQTWIWAERSELASAAQLGMLSRGEGLSLKYRLTMKGTEGGMDGALSAVCVCDGVCGGVRVCIHF